MTSPKKLGDVIQDHGREDGFTILELLVVIGIIGILSAVAIPVFNVQRKKAADASVRSDIQSVAQTYIGWQATGKKNKDFWGVSGNRVAMHAIDPASYTMLEGENWNVAVPDYQVKVSKSNAVQIVVREKTREGSFCLVGTGTKSQWNYTSGAGMQANFDKALYFDMEAGGIKTMAELITLKTSGAFLACEDYVTSYQAAGGM